MSQPQILLDAFGKTLKPTGFKKKADSWYLDNGETLGVLNLQKSSYGKQYYVNVAIWLKCLGEAEFPKAHKCHIYFRWEALIPQDKKQVGALLNLENQSLTEQERVTEISKLLDTYVVPFYTKAKSIAALKQIYKAASNPFTMVTNEAWRILNDE